MRLTIVCALYYLSFLMVRAVRIIEADSDEPIENADYEAVTLSTTPVPLYYARNITDDPPKDDGNLTLSTELAGQRCLKSVYNSYLRGWRTEEDEKLAKATGQGLWKVDMAPHCDTCEHWNIEDRNGKVMLQANCFPGKYLRAKDDGSLILTSEWGEYWTPFKDDDGSWSLRSKHGTWLHAEPNGRVSLQDKKREDGKFRLQSPFEEDSEEEEDKVITSSTLSTATLFTLITTSTIPSSTTVSNPILNEENGDLRHSESKAGLHCVRGVHRMYLRAANTSSAWSVDMAPYGKGCTHLWTIEDHHGKVALKETDAGLFLRATPDGKVDLAEWGNEGVLWTPFKNEDTWSSVNRHGPWGTWSLKSIHGTWLRGHAHGAVSLKDHLMADEKFRLESDGDSELNRSTETSTTTVSSISMEEEKDDPRHSTELAGRHCVRGVHWMYLRVTKGTESSVDMAPFGHECEHPWNIEDHDGKVALKAESRVTYLRANPDGSVDLAEWGKAGVLWSPFKNEDGSWSLRSIYGTWLRAQPGHGRVSLQEHRKADEHFWIESWKEPTSSASGTAYEWGPAGADDWEDLSASEHRQSEQRNLSVSLIIAVLLLFIAVICATIYTVFHVRRLIIKRRKLSNDRLFLVRYLVDEDVELRDNHARSHYYAEEA